MILWEQHAGRLIRFNFRLLKQMEATPTQDLTGNILSGLNDINRGYFKVFTQVKDQFIWNNCESKFLHHFVVFQKTCSLRGEPL